jgi:hypothetical protein
MFTLKQGFDFGEVARRGLDAVHGELLEKALATISVTWRACVKSPGGGGQERRRAKAPARGLTRLGALLGSAPENR